MPPTDPRVDELRQQLRELGYLDAGVDRFVLGPARETRRPAAIALFAGARTGLIAAVLLGPAAAIGIGGRLPGLVTGPRDAIIVAIYLGVLFGIAVAFAAFAFSILFAALAGDRVVARAPVLSRVAGAIVTVVCLAYLTLWWNTATSGFGLEAPAWTAFALLVAVAISLLLGHATSVTAFAVMIAGRGHVAGAVRIPPPRTSWPIMLGAGALAFAGSAILLVSTGERTQAADSAPPPLAVVSSGVRVRLFAIDGFDPGVYQELAAAGDLPTLAATLGAAHARLTADETRDPARAWTTIATGQPPEVHGVRSLETTRVAGVQGTVTAVRQSAIGRSVSAATDLLRLTRPSIASGTERRVKTLWEAASDAGLRTSVVNWWATWPAPSDAGVARGVVVSDRATLRLERGGALDAEIAPASLYAKLEAEWPAIKREAAGGVSACLPAGAQQDSPVGAVLHRSAEIDALQIAIASRVTEPTTDLVAAYLPGMDIAQHALLASDAGGLGAAALAARVEGIKRYYRFLDCTLARALNGKEADRLVMLVTEPGRVVSSADGMFAVAGAQARKGAIIERANMTDVAPTVLHALGVPVSRELAGRSLVELFAESFTARYPVRYVSTYGQRSSGVAERKGQPLDEEMIDRLRSLGYVR